LRRSIVNSSVSGLCVTKLDVLDELETIQICAGYAIDGKPINGVPVVVDRFAECKPIYEEWPGWQESTVGITDFDNLPIKARDYLERIEALAGVPIDIISTGPDREQTIIKTHPFA
jgi:adenylosuccinate synthase